MKRIIFLLLSFTCSQFAVTAQFKTVAEGAPMEEPRPYFNRIIQMKEGSTFFIQLKEKEGIQVQFYNEKHKLVSTKSYKPKVAKLDGMWIYGSFESNKDAVLLLGEIIRKSSAMYRFIFDGANGTLKEEITITDIDRDMADPYFPFDVKIDKHTGHYTIAIPNLKKGDDSKGLEVILFGSDNKQIGKTFYKVNVTSYKNFRYNDMCLVDKELYISGQAYDKESDYRKGSDVVLGKVVPGGTEVEFLPLSFVKDKYILGGILRYNPVTNKLLWLLAIRDDKDRSSYESAIATINPATKELESAVSAYPEQASIKAKELSKKGRPFTGMPQNMFVNADGTYSVVSEEIGVENSGSVSAKTLLGNMAVAIYDNEGKQVTSYLVRKKSWINGNLYPFYHADLDDATSRNLFMGNQYKYFVFANGKKNRYVLLNDLAKRIDEDPESRRIPPSIADCDAFAFNVSGTEIASAPKLLFSGAPITGENNLGLLNTYDFEPESGLFVTLRLTREGRDKVVRLTWVQLD